MLKRSSWSLYRHPYHIQRLGQPSVPAVLFRSSLGRPTTLEWRPKDMGMVAATPAEMASLAGQTGDMQPGEDDVASVVMSNDEHEDFTVIRLRGRDNNTGGLLAKLTILFAKNELTIASANISTEDDGTLQDVFNISDVDGNKVSEERWPSLQSEMLAMLTGTSRSSMPAIFGVQAEDEMAPLTSVASETDISALEMAAAEMSTAAAALVSMERSLNSMTTEGALVGDIETQQSQRAEASSRLERKMAAMEAILVSRRKAIELPLKPLVPAIPAFFQPPPSVVTTGPAAGNGYEIILQGFNWESCKEQWYTKLAGMAPEIADAGFTTIWLPPASDAVSPQGYLPRDLYNLNSKYGSEVELRNLMSTLHELGLKAVADIVINHRCAHYQGPDGKWNKFGGRLAWDSSVICSNNPAFGGSGSRKKCEDYSAAPNLDHSQERVRKDIIEWMRYLRNSIGYDGWRFDFVKGYDGKHVREYVDATVPEMAFGEYWDTCSYTDGVLNYNQDNHRQRTVDWCDKTGGTCAAFDFTLKGVMQEAVSRNEYWRLSDSKGRPPGVLGIWPSRAITFLENHDTGSTLQHWPFPWKRAAEGYCYLLSHPGTPCIFYDHFYFDEILKGHILKFIAIRKRFKIYAKSEVVIRKAYNELYAAVIDKKVAMKIGPADWSPKEDKIDLGQKDWKLLHSGPNFAMWEAVF